MEYTDEIILDIIKYLELDPNMIDILEDNNVNITIKKIRRNNHE